MHNSNECNGIKLVYVVTGTTISLKQSLLKGCPPPLREDSCLMVTYAVFLSLEFLVLLAGIVASVRLLFDIQTGLLDADVVPELTMYDTDPWVRYKWDTLQSKREWGILV